MATAHHIEYADFGTDLDDAARVAMEKSGEQWTDMRATVFRVIAEFGRPAAAYDIAERVSQKRGKRVAPNSVYRILDVFLANNLVRRIESANAFIANSHPGCVHDCIFMICDSCGSATHVDDDGIARAVRAAATGAGFTPARPVIEVRGLCGACA